jgi:D-xylose transport system permease protein
MSQADELTTQDALLNAHTEDQSVAGFIRNYFQRVRAGDLGLLPIILGLVVIAIIFQSLNQNYLTPRNFVNLIVQMAGITTIAIGVVFVLLLGEIDLSIGYVSAVAAVFLAMRLRPPDGWHWLLWP